MHFPLTSGGIGLRRENFGLEIGKLGSGKKGAVATKSRAAKANGVPFGRHSWPARKIVRKNDRPAGRRRRRFPLEPRDGTNRTRRRRGRCRPGRDGGHKTAAWSCWPADG